MDAVATVALATTTVSEASAVATTTEAKTVEDAIATMTITKLIGSSRASTKGRMAVT